MLIAKRSCGFKLRVREHVEAGTAIFTDELRSYDGLETEYQHAVINHAVEYVKWGSAQESDEPLVSAGFR